MLVVADIDAEKKELEENTVSGTVKMGKPI